MLAAPGSPEFLAEFQQAKQDTKAPLSGTLRASIYAYRKSSAFAKLNPKGRGETVRRLDQIGLRFGSAPLAVFADARIRAKIIDWQEQWRDRPRAADLLAGTLAQVLAREVNRGALPVNHALKLPKLYQPISRAKIIWEADELEALCAAANPAAARAFRLAAVTGLRRADLTRITWDADKGTHLEWVSAKRKREVLIPISQQARAVLNSFPKSAVTIVTNSKGQPYTAEGLGSAFQMARKRSKTTKRFHDLRGTAATHFAASLDDRTLAEIMGWSIEETSAIRRRYVDRNKIISASIARLNRNQKAT
jgi:integrase